LTQPQASKREPAGIGGDADDGAAAPVDSAGRHSQADAAKWEISSCP
jgi:hypothetical protein